MNKNTAAKIIDEILQLKEQYVAEVGKGGRKAWPKSIRDRVLTLCDSGMAVGEVSKLTGIPYHSTLSWRRGAGMVRPKKSAKAAKFHAMTVTDPVPARDVTVTSKSRTVTVRVDGLGDILLSDVGQAAELVLRIREGSGHAL